MLATILKDHADSIKEVEVVYQCEFQKRVRTPGTKEYQFFKSLYATSGKSKKPPPMAIRDGLRGGCVELFSVDAEADENHETNTEQNKDVIKAKKSITKKYSSGILY